MGKGAIHIIESTLAIFLLMSFIVFALKLNNVETQNTVSVQYGNDYLRSIILWPNLTFALKYNDLSILDDELKRSFAYDYSLSEEIYHPNVFLVNQSEYYSEFNVLYGGKSILLVFSPQKTQTNITINSNLVFNSHAVDQIYRKDVSFYVLKGKNEINVSTTTPPVYILIFDINSSVSSPFTENYDGVATQYFYDGEEVHILYVFVH